MNDCKLKPRTTYKVFKTLVVSEKDRRRMSMFTYSGIEHLVRLTSPKVARKLGRITDRIGEDCAQLGRLVLDNGVDTLDNLDFQ
jgi:hypothetical protein